MQSLSSIWSYYNGLPSEDRPAVAILAVATHRDKVSIEKIKEVNELLKGTHEVESVVREGLLVKHGDSVIVPINNYDEEDGKKVRKIIEKVVA